MQDTIHICYSGNKKIFPGLLLSVMSLVKFSSRPLKLYILSMDMHELNPLYIPFSDNQIEILNTVLKEKNPESSARLVDMTQIHADDLANGKSAECYYTPYTLLRLYMDKLTDTPDKMVYLDIDTMAADDIGILYDTELGDHEFGAVLDHMGKFWISRTYCNAGVLLLNIAEMKRTNLFEKARNYVYTHKMTMPDQTALHCTVQRKLILPRRFNEQRKLHDDTVVKHFCRGIFWWPFFHIYNIKQWQRDAVHKRLKMHFFDDIYEQFDRLAQQYDIEK